MAENDKKLTVKEFKMWLEGVEDMMQDVDGGWTPSAAQWKRIRDKINEINVDDVVSRVVAPSQPIRPVDDLRDSEPATFGVPIYTPSNMMPDPNRDLAGRPFLSESVGIPTRGMSIDTSNGQYKSAFA